MPAQDLAHPGGLLVIPRKQSRVRGPRDLAAGAAAFVMLSIPAAATAQSNGADGFSTGMPDEGRIVSIGLVSGSGSPYPGARRREPFAYPTLDIRRAGQPFPLSSPDDGIGVAILDTSRFKLGPVATLRQTTGTDRIADPARLPWTVEAGAFADYWLDPDRLRTRVELRHGVRGNDGFSIDLSADMYGHVGPLTLSVGPRFGFLDQRVARLEFETARIGSRDPVSGVGRGGLESIGLSSALDVDWSDAWRSTVYARLDRLVGDASAVAGRAGSSNQLRVGLGLTYSFHLDVPRLP